MKASELMQGDIVLYEYDGQKFPARVIEIYRNSVLVESIDSEYEPIEIEEDKIFPVDLTPEILEKNRMKVFEHRNPWQEAKNLIKKWYSKDGKFYVSYYRVGDMFTYTVGNGVSRICSIRYVHELQHALRLGGIEKEIEL